MAEPNRELPFVHPSIMEDIVPDALQIIAADTEMWQAREPAYEVRVTQGLASFYEERQRISSVEDSWPIDNSDIYLLAQHIDFQTAFEMYAANHKIFSVLDENQTRYFLELTIARERKKHSFALEANEVLANYFNPDEVDVVTTEETIDFYDKDYNDERDVKLAAIQVKLHQRVSPSDPAANT